MHSPGATVVTTASVPVPNTIASGVVLQWLRLVRSVRGVLALWARRTQGRVGRCRSGRRHGSGVARLGISAAAFAHRRDNLITTAADGLRSSSKRERGERGR